MVATGSAYDFRSIAEEFFAHRKVGGPHGEALAALARQRAQEILAHPDVRYMPAFKILDLLAVMVNTAAAIGEETQLHRHEAATLLSRGLAENAPLVRSFLLEAALERARYEPMMLHAPSADAATRRTLLLRKRWRAMCEAHRTGDDLPENWLAAIDGAVESAITAPCFQDFRTGPMLQLFAEMLALARQSHGEGKPLTSLHEIIGPQGQLWRRYALKRSRFKKSKQAAPPASAESSSTQTLH